MEWRKVLGAGSLAVAICTVGVAPGAWADEATEARMLGVIERLEQRVLELEERLTEQEAAMVDVHRLEGEVVTLKDDAAHWQNLAVDSGSDFNISGYVETSYNFNTNDPRGPRPGGPTNVGRIFDVEDDTFNLDAIKLVLENTADEPGDAGFRVDLLFGQQADLIDLDPAFGAPGALSGPDAVEIMQGYVSYIADVGNGLEVKAGKFVTWIGYEVIESHLNPNFSRAFTFGYSIPFTHTGVGATYQINDLVTYSHFIVNGWDNTADNNDAKSTGGQLVLTPEESVTFGIPMEFYFNYIVGREGGPPGDDDRYVLDGIITAQLNDQWSAALNVDYGESDFDDLAIVGVSGDEWFGIAGYLMYQHTDALSFALRGEYWEEDEGTRTGIMSTDRMLGQDLELIEVTFTANYQLTDNLLIRGELRYDDANRDVFLGDGPMEFEDGQFTIGGAATYEF